MPIRVRFAAVLAALSVSACVALTADRVAAQDISRDGPEYQICYEKLTQEPLASYAQRIDDGGVQNTRRILLETELVGVRCSDEQLIAFMEHHGMPYEGTLEIGRAHTSGRSTYNRLLGFCVLSPTWIDRLLRGRCSGVAEVFLLDDQVAQVISHGAL